MCFSKSVLMEKKLALAVRLLLLQSTQLEDPEMKIGSIASTLTLFCVTAFAQTPISLDISAVSDLDSVYIELNWNQVPNATQYLVYQRGSIGDSLIGTTDGIDFTFSIANGWTWYSTPSVKNSYYVTSILQDDSLLDGILAFYRFNGNAINEIGSASNGEMHGCVSAADRYGTASSCLFFDGVDDYVSVSPTINPDFITVMCWFFIDDTSFDSHYSILRHRPAGYHLFVDNQDGTSSLGANTFFQDGSSYMYRPYSGDFSNQWVNLAYTYDGITSSVYVNGTLVDQTIDHEDYSPIRYDPGGFAIGRGGNVPLFNFRGRIDDVLIYDRALSASQILTLYNFGVY